MRIVCSTLAFRKYGLKEALERARALGFDTVELCANAHHSDPEHWDMGRDELIACIHRLGVKVGSVHVPLEARRAFSLCERNEEELTLSLRAADTAALLDGEFIVQHLELVNGAFDGKSENPLRSTVPNLETVLGEVTVKKIRVAIENAPNSSFRMFGNSVEEILHLLRWVPPESGGLCLDFTHCLACGLDPLEILERIDPSRLISIHASDNVSAPWADRHLPVGDGTIPWARLFDQLKTMGFRGSFVIEVFDEKALVDSLRYLASLRLVDPEELPALKAFRSNAHSGKGGETRQLPDAKG